MNEKLVEAVASHLPELIAAGKSLFARANPTDPMPTDEEVMAAYHHVLESSLAKDELWLKENPPKNEPPTNG